jgi:hypothetical protein
MQRIKIQLNLAEAVLRAIQTGDIEKLINEIEIHKRSLVIIEAEIQDRQDQLAIMFGG